MKETKVFLVEWMLYFLYTCSILTRVQVHSGTLVEWML